MNHQLTALGAEFVRACRSSSAYRMYAITDAQRRTKPGMIKVRDGSGTSIYLELFKLPTENVGRFLEQIPPPLGLGTVDLEDGGCVKGFICEGYVASADSGFEVEDITHLRSWLDFVKQRTS